MASPPRPTDFPVLDLLESNQTDWRISPLRTTGFQTGQPVPSREHNTLWFLNGMWGIYADYGAPHLVDFVDTTTNTRWSTTKLAYTVGADIKDVGANPSSTAVYFINGCRVEIDEAVLNPVGAWPLFQPDVAYPCRIWIYVDANLVYPTQPMAQARVQRVAPATAESPNAGEIALVGVDADAAGLITAIVYPASEPEYHFRFDGPTFTWHSPVVYFDAVDFGSETVAHTGFAAEGLITKFGETATLVVEGTSVITGNAKIGGDLNMDSGNITSANNIGCAALTATGNVHGATASTSGLATLNSASVTTTLVVGGVLTANGGINLASQTLQGAASSVVDVERVLPDKIEYTNMGSSYSTTGGHSRWNATALMFSQHASLGETTAIADPRRGWDAAFTTVNSIDDTDAETTRVVQENEPVWINISFRFAGTSAGSNLNWRIEVSGTPGTSDVVIDAFVIDLANRGYPFHIAYQWTPSDDFIAPGTAGYSFKVRLGVSAGTLTANYISIEVTSALAV